MKCAEQLNPHCEVRFTNIDETLKEVRSDQKKMYQRLFETNGKRALVEVVNDNAKAIAEIKKPMPTLSGRENGTKIELGKLKISTNSVEVGKFLMASVALVLLGFILYFGRDKLELLRTLEKEMLGNPEVVANHPE